MLGVILLSFSFLLNAQEIRLKIPLYLKGVVNGSGIQGDYLDYKITGRIEPILISGKVTKNKTPEELLSSLIRAYKTADKKLFIDIHTDLAKSKIQKMSKQEFDKNWKFYEVISEVKIDYYFAYEGGIILSWSSPVFKKPQIHFLRKIDGQWLFDAKDFSSKDPFLHNVSLYLTYFPLKVSPVKELTIAKKEKNLEISFKSDLQDVYLFKREGKRWDSRTKIRDNAKDEFPIDDIDPNPLAFRFVLKPEYFGNDGVTELMALSANFPMSYIPKKHIKNEIIKFEK